MTDQYVDGGDIDLNEEVIYVGGKRLTEADAEALAEETLASRTGRPSLADGTSPTLTIRVPSLTKRRLTDQARREHRPVAAVTRDAIEAYLVTHNG